MKQFVEAFPLINLISTATVTWTSHQRGICFVLGKRFDNGLQLQAFYAVLLNSIKESTCKGLWKVKRQPQLRAIPINPMQLKGTKVQSYVYSKLNLQLPTEYFALTLV